MGKMKKLLSILVLLFGMSTCKKVSKINPAKVIVVNEQLEKIVSEKEQTIEYFLKQLQIAVEKKDIDNIENKIIFPLKFSSGGESIFYNNYQEIKEDGSNEEFSKILEAKFIGIEDGFYMIEYQDPQSIDYFITFYFIKSIDGFKLKSFSEPY